MGCFGWSQLLNAVRTYFERTCPPPRLRPPDGGAKQNIFLFFQFWRATLFPLKGIEKCFALLLLTEQESGAVPTPVPLRGMAGGQKFLPPNPPSFLPARAFSLAREARRQFRSKKVRIWSNKRTIAGQFSQVGKQVASIASGFERPAKIALILF